MATFRLNSITKIGAFKPFIGLNEAVIKKSIRNYCDTAILKLPASSVLKIKGVAQTKSVDTAKQFKRGDKVNVQLGYNGIMRDEFEGFVTRVNKATPCEIECEGYAFQLRNKQINKIWKNTTLKTVLKEIISGTDIILDTQIQDVPLDRIDLPKMSCFNAIEALNKQLVNVFAFWFDKNVLYAGLALTKMSEKNRSRQPDVKYKIGYNIVRDGQMKERIAGDDKVEVEIIYKVKNGKKEIAKAGLPNSNSVRKRSQAAKDFGLRQDMADEAEMAKNYTGYEGKLNGFLQPYCKPGDKVNINDPRYPEVNGDFLIESTEVKYNRNGGRRASTISIKL